MSLKSKVQSPKSKDQELNFIAWDFRDAYCVDDSKAAPESAHATRNTHHALPLSERRP